MEAANSSSSSNTSSNWLELSAEVMGEILQRVGPVDLLNNAQLVCKHWLSVSKDPFLWRVIDMHIDGDVWDLPYSLEKMCMRAVDRSEGGLVDINVEYFGTDDLFEYIAERSSHLRRLRLMCCDINSDCGFTKLPMLEELDLSFCYVSEETLEVVGHSCPLLKSLKLSRLALRPPYIGDDAVALTIARTMPELRQLCLLGNELTNVGLEAILDGCPHLESLDLRQCFCLCLEGKLLQRCSDQTKSLRLPLDSIDDYDIPAAVREEYGRPLYGDDYTDSDYDYEESVSSEGSDDDYPDYDDLLFYGPGSP